MRCASKLRITSRQNLTRSNLKRAAIRIGSSLPPHFSHTDCYRIHADSFGLTVAICRNIWQAALHNNVADCMLQCTVVFGERDVGEYRLVDLL